MTVFCTEDPWLSHITATHPDLSKNQRVAEMAIKDPARIYSDADNAGRECYYRRDGNEYMKIVVEIRSGNRAEVITAFFTSRPNNKERLQWQKI